MAEIFQDKDSQASLGNILRGALEELSRLQAHEIVREDYRKETSSSLPLILQTLTVAIRLLVDLRAEQTSAVGAHEESAGEVLAFRSNAERLLEARTSIDQLQHLVGSEGALVARDAVAAISALTRAVAALALIDECQKAVPYQPMARVRKADGTMVWRCLHDPPHES
ncbi:hypothetical protein [Afifella sp. YEN Y35]|uniref:hypothetical protein n=1 Tax=Afifella sp. YEN Y35 TaxID=3388337 RepID=UPI0039DF5F97